MSKVPVATTDAQIASQKIFELEEGVALLVVVHTKIVPILQSPKDWDLTISDACFHILCAFFGESFANEYQEELKRSVTNCPDKGISMIFALEILEDFNYFFELFETRKAV